MRNPIPHCTWWELALAAACAVILVACGAAVVLSIDLAIANGGFQ